MQKRLAIGPGVKILDQKNEGGGGSTSSPLPVYGLNRCVLSLFKLFSQTNTHFATCT